MEKFLGLMVEKSGSDLFITAGVPPSMKVHGKIFPHNNNPLAPEKVRDIVYGLMNSKQQQEFEETKELNFAINATRLGRFRASAFCQRNVCGYELRRIETNIPTTDQLGLPDIIKAIPLTKRGSNYLVDETGAGLSTSLASMIN